MRKPLLVQLFMALFALGFVALPAMVRAADGSIVALTPRPNDHLAKAPAVIAIQLPGGAHISVDKSAVRLVVDGRDVSDGVTVTGTRVEYKPSPALIGGEHAVQIEYADKSGGRLSYAWTFTVDGGPAPQQAADATAAALRGIGLPDDGSAGMNAGASAAQPPSSEASGDTGASAPQQVYQTQNYYAGGYGGYGGYGGFYPIGGGPYYWGDNAMFQFVGVPGGYGFLTFGGIPGFFNLMPLGINTFYAVIPIPIGYYFSSPFITCHFFFPSGGGTVAGLPSFPIVRHRRPPPAHNAVVGRSLQLPQTPQQRSTAFTSAMPGEGARFNTTRPVGTRPVGARPIVRAPAPMHPVTAPHILAPQPIIAHPISAPHPVAAPVFAHPISLGVPVGHIR